MDAATRDFIRRRAGNRCEYCLLPQEYCDLTHRVEHILSKQHGGLDTLDNLALACHRCNLRKGPNLSSIDAVTRRATVQVLAMNEARRTELRSAMPPLNDRSTSR